MAQDEVGQFSGDRGHGLGSTEAAVQMSVAAVEAGLRFQGDLDELCRDSLQSPFDLAVERGRVASVVGGLNEDVAEIAVTGMGDTALSSRMTAEVLQIAGRPYGFQRDRALRSP